MSEPFIGQIMPVGFNFPPRGWSFCNGQLLPINQNTALFALLGTTFGGDGRTNFALPDLRGRSMVHVGRGAGLSPVSWGERFGSELVALTEPHLPSHTHTATLHAESGAATAANPKDKMLAAATTYAPPVTADNKAMYKDSVTVDPTGGGQPFATRDPSIGIYMCIAIVGIYPSRN